MESVEMISFSGVPAFANVVPALFGAMAYMYYRKNLKLALAPLLLMSALFILVPSLISSTSMMIIPSGALTIALAYLIWKKRGTILALPGTDSQKTETFGAETSAAETSGTNDTEDVEK